jgi:uncharacterized protein YegP (UPF0339 family)
MVRTPEFKTFRDFAGKWRWHLIGANSEIVAASGESFSSKAHAERAVRDAKRLAAQARLPVTVDVGAVLRVMVRRRHR